MSNTLERCYLCGILLQTYTLKPGERPPADQNTRDHVPPAGLFPPPKPSDLIALPCCFQCNNQHSGFDERLRLVASMPFDRNAAGETIMKDRVLGRTLTKGRQMEFAARLLESMRLVSGEQNLIRVRMSASEFREGMIRITKGLLFAFHPKLDYHSSAFDVVDIQPVPCTEQLRLM